MNHLCRTYSDQASDKALCNAYTLNLLWLTDLSRHYPEHNERLTLSLHIVVT